MVLAKLGLLSPMALLACTFVSAVCLFVVWQLSASQSGRRSNAATSEHHFGNVLFLWTYRTVFVVVVLQFLAFLRYSFGSLNADVYRLFLPVYYVCLVLSAACLAITLVAMAFVTIRSLRR